MHSNYQIQDYIEKLKNPEIREIYTRLRIDLNCLSTCKVQGTRQLELCPFCTLEPEDVKHFLFHCEKYQNLRSDFYKKLSEEEPAVNFAFLISNEKLLFIPNAEASDSTIGICCKFVKRMYSERLSDVHSCV